ncbi:MAG: type 4a pilus biogenesis protein PilO [Candidatus Hydrogenedentes bacterium]|nr:type 4a pilus biogenesis protein PilO [Candidatus Hydrogenedentota bacterium]
MEALKGKVTPKDWMAVGGVVAVVVAILALYFFFVHKNQITKLDELTAQITTIQTDLREAHKKEQNIAALREEAAAIETLVADFERRLPEQREIPTLVRQFEQMANDVGLSHALKPESPIRDERKETIPYSITTYGTFHQTTSFINRLERFERFLKVSNLKIEEEKDAVSKATFTLSTYRFLAPTTKPATPPAQTASAAAPQPGGAS